MTTHLLAPETGTDQRIGTSTLRLAACVMPELAALADLEEHEARVDVAEDPEVVTSIKAFAESLSVVTGRRETYDDVYERELRFFGKVYDAAMEMSAGHDDKVVLIFDVDQTIAEGISKERIIRPAFPWVIDALHDVLGDRLQVGLLTSLPNNGSAYDSFLSDIKPSLVNRDYLLSTRDYVLPPPQAALHSAEDIDACYLPQIEEIIDPAIAAAVKTGKIETNRWHDPDGKQEILQSKLQTAKENNTRILYIDNMAPAAAIRQDHPYIRGLCVAPEVQNSTYRIGSEAAYRHVENVRATSTLPSEI